MQEFYKNKDLRIADNHNISYNEKVVKERTIIMLWNIFLLIIGFIILVKGADLFVDAATSLAENFHLSKMLIALTIVAFGTSAPEFAVSIQAIMSGSGDIVLGNVIGSNILNILLILGVASLIHPLNVKNATVKKELPITLLITTLFVVLINDVTLSGASENILSRADGITILLFFLVFVYYLLTIMRNKKDKEEEQKPPKYNILLSILFTIIGIGCLILGSNLVVNSSSNIATFLGVSERLIALTIIALGTSLPELVTSIVATKKGEYDIAIGNVVGSNIFNIGIVLGLPVLLFGNISHISFNSMDLLVMLLADILLFAFSFKDKKINRIEGFIFIMIFLIYYGNLILTSI